MRELVSSRDLSAGFPSAVGGDWTQQSGVGIQADDLSGSAFVSARLACKQEQTPPAESRRNFMTEHAGVFLVTHSCRVRRYAFLSVSTTRLCFRLCNILRRRCCPNELTSQLSWKTRSTFSLRPKVRVAVQVKLFALLGHSSVLVKFLQLHCHRALPLQVLVNITGGNVSSGYQLTYRCVCIK